MLVKDEPKKIVAVHPEIEIRVLRTYSELEELRPFWESWPGVRDSDIDFYLTVCEWSPEVVRPHIITIYRNGTPSAIFVGRLDESRIHFRLGYFTVKPKARLLYFVFGALRGDASRENAELILREICGSLSEGQADAAYLNCIPTDSDLYRLSHQIPGLLSRDRVCAAQDHFIMKVANSVEEFQQSFSPKVRKNHRWQAKKLASDFGGAVKIQCFRAADQIDVFVKDVEQVASKSYQRGLGVGFYDTPEMRQRLRLSAEKGWLRAYVLYVAGRPSAFWIGDLYNQVFLSCYLGHDDTLAKYSPGMYLITKVVETFCGGTEGAREVDFGIGSAQYKQILGSYHCEEAPVYIFSKSLKGLKLNLVRLGTTGIDEIVKRVLGQTELYHKIKKALRNRAKATDQGQAAS